MFKIRSFAGLFLFAGAVFGSVTLVIGCPSEISRLAKTEMSEDNVTTRSIAQDDDEERKAVQLHLPRALFDGKSLKGWKATNFGGEGEVEVREGAIQLAMGYPMTGVTSTDETLPTNQYEISLEAMRIDGNDFFCGLTFPVDDSHCSLVVGGWGGTLVGLSSIDGMDAANNDTMLHMDFENGRWYKIRLKVGGGKIVVWIDGKQVIEADVAGKELTVRNEVLPSRPLGICGFQSPCAIRKVFLKSKQSKKPSSKKDKVSSTPPSSKPIKQGK